MPDLEHSSRDVECLRCMNGMKLDLCPFRPPILSILYWLLFLSIALGIVLSFGIMPDLFPCTCTCSGKNEVISGHVEYTALDLLVLCTLHCEAQQAETECSCRLSGTPHSIISIFMTFMIPCRPAPPPPPPPPSSSSTTARAPAPPPSSSSTTARAPAPPPSSSSTTARAPPPPRPPARTKPSLSSRPPPYTPKPAHL